MSIEVSCDKQLTPAKWKNLFSIFSTSKFNLEHGSVTLRERSVWCRLWISVGLIYGLGWANERTNAAFHLNPPWIQPRCFVNRIVRPFFNSELMDWSGVWTGLIYFASWRRWHWKFNVSCVCYNYWFWLTLCIEYPKVLLSLNYIVLGPFRFHKWSS